MITKKIKKSILAHAAESYPREACGVIVGKEYVPCTNIAVDDRQFEIDPKDLVKIKEPIRAYVHSHPDGSTAPSVPDLMQMGLQKIPWVITDGVEVKTHRPKKYKAPLIGREYYHGMLDCYSIVRDYFARELNINLRDYDRNDAWWEDAKSTPLYLENFKAENFVEVTQLQKHDVILCRLGRTEHVNHALIYLADGRLTSEYAPEVVGSALILHHPYNRPSLRELYSEHWQRRAAIILRHKDLV